MRHCDSSTLVCRRNSEFRKPSEVGSRSSQDSDSIYWDPEDSGDHYVVRGKRGGTSLDPCPECDAPAPPITSIRFSSLERLENKMVGIQLSHTLFHCSLSGCRSIS